MSHNHLLFPRDAIEAYFEAGDWERMEHCAAELERYTRSEPLPFADFYIARGRALAARGGRRPNSESLTAELERIHNEGERLGIRVALRQIVNAIEEMRGSSARPGARAHGNTRRRHRGRRRAFPRYLLYHRLACRPGGLGGSAVIRPGGLLMDPGVREGFARLAPLGLSFDAWMYHTQLGELVDLARAFPETRIVLDHVGGAIGLVPYAGKRDEVLPN